MSRYVPLSAIASRQHGAVSVEQLVALGFDHQSIARAVAAGHLHRADHGVYLVGHTAPGHLRDWMVAVLGGGPHAMLTGVAAGQLRGIWRGNEPRIDVLARRHVQRATAVQYRRCRVMPESELVRGIPVAGVSRGLVDMADVLTEYQLANVMHEAEFRGCFEAATGRAALAQARGRRGAGRLRSGLGLWTAGNAGTMSRTEDEAVRVLLEGGVRVDGVNPVVVTPGGSYRVDLVWWDQRLCVEIDGRGHRRLATAEQDRLRDAHLRAAGWQVLRFGLQVVWRQPVLLVNGVRAAL